MTEQQELDYLRYFYSNARHSMGPSDSESYHCILQEYITNNPDAVLGEPYIYDEED